MKSISVIALFICFLIVNAQSDGSVDAALVAQQEQDLEMLNELSSRLVNSLKIVQNLRDGPQGKVAEKRRNKFEFIRFGRK